MVRFLEDPEQYKTCEMIERIDSSIQRYAIDRTWKFGFFQRVKSSCYLKQALDFSFDTSNREMNIIIKEINFLRVVYEF